MRSPVSAHRKRGRLDCDTAAFNAGWRLDRDGWWWRWRKPGDIVIPDGAAYFGFTMEDVPDEDKVFIRSAAYALAYDRGEVTPYA